MLKRTLHIAWLATAGGVFLLAVLLTVARVWAPSLGAGYRHDIEAAASRALQRPLSIGRVEATWRGLHPVFRLKNIVIAGGQGMQPLGVREIQVGIDTAHFLRTRELRFANIEVIGASLTLARRDDGRLILEEFAGRQDVESGFTVLARMSRLSIRDAEVTVSDIPRGAGTQHFTAVNVTLVNEGNDHRVTGHAQLPGQYGERIEIVARLRGDVAHPADWRGRAYFKGASLALSSLLAPVLEPAQSVQGVADLRLWAELAASRIIAVSGELELDALRMAQTAANRQSLFEADRLQTVFGWRQTGAGWQGVLQHLHVERAGRAWRTGRLSLAGLPLADGVQVRLQSARIDLEEIAGLLAVLPGVDAGMRETLVAARPTGLIEDLSCTVTRHGDTFGLDQVAARFAGLGMQQAGTLPSVAGLDGTVSGDARAGTVALGSTELTLQDNRLFRRPLQFERAGGAVHWRRVDGGLELRSESLELGNAHLALDVRFSLLLPHDGGPATTDTVIQVQEFDVAHAADYLPALHMSPAAVAWLDRSLAGGTVRDGSVVIQGRLDQLPYDHGEGRLEARLPVFDATLDFDEHWSPVSQLAAQVEFTGRRLDVRSRKGFIRTAALRDVHARIDDLVHPTLTVDGDVHGALPVMLAELGSSPLGTTYGGFVDRVVTTGNVDLGLHIVLPLQAHHTEDVTVTGTIRLRDNSLKLADSDIVLENLRGRLEFDGQGVRGDNLQAGLFGRTASARVWTGLDPPATHLTLDGRLGLLEHAAGDSAALRGLFSGEADWHVELTAKGRPVRGRPRELGLSVRSSLQGVAIDLPAPLGKPAATERPLTLEASLRDGSEYYVRAEYGDVLQSVLVLGEGAQGIELQRGNIALGGETPEPPQIPQLLISGKLDRFRLTDWQKHLGADSDGRHGPPLRLSLKVASLELFGYRLPDSGIDMVETGTGWTIKTLGPAAEGEVRLATRAGAIEAVTLDLQRLALEPVGAAGRSREAPRPEDFPLLAGSIRQLVYDGVDLGSLELQTQRRTDAGYRIERLALASRLLSAQMSGDWRSRGADQVTQAELTVTDGNVGALLDALGYQKLMKGGRPAAHLKATWRGAPWDLRAEIVDGRIDAVIKDGQLLEVEPGATGRALGLLSLTKLPKRLTLDFTDLFGEGFSFDSIRGDFVLDNGNAYTENMVIDGPAAKIEIAGRVGLAAQDYDELVTVTPYLNSSLPLAGALAGGPAVGAAVIVAEKLLEDSLRLNELARKRYEVTGPWSDPLVTQLNPPARDTTDDTHFDDESFFQ
jgi:uncharacterized protein (TIGR02099 family)